MKKLYLLLISIFIMLFAIFSAVLLCSSDSYFVVALVFAAPTAAIIVFIIAITPKRK